MELAKIYRKDAKGSIRIWWAEIGEGSLQGCWRTHSGLLNGEIVSSEWKTVTIRSKDSMREQALFYAEAEMKKKLRTDYRTSIDNIDEPRYSFIRPMLANDYVGWSGPCFVQPKLDGMRCLANKDGLWSRRNRKVISTPHIEGALKQFFQKHPNIIIDGELYNHNLSDNFNLIMSLSRKTKPEFADLQRSEKYIQYWVFDMFDLDEPDAIFEERWNFLHDNLFNKFSSKCIVRTQTCFAKTQEELDIFNMKLLELGYEGQMIRFNLPYEEKRTDTLLKRKEFQDQEFELIDIEEGQGNWEGYAKIAICALPNGERFGAGISGTQEFCAKLLEEKDKYKSVTVKYQALTPDGIPRFPIATKFYEELFDGLEERIKLPKRDLFA
jgi:DNA ligase-1